MRGRGGGLFQQWWVWPATAAAIALWSVCVVPGWVFGGAGTLFPFRSYVDIGEALAHGLRPPGMHVSYHMPGASLAAAWLFNHIEPAWLEVAAGALGLAAAGLVAALGVLLGSPWSGLLAAAGLLLVPGIWYEKCGYSHFVHSLHVLLVAGVQAWRTRCPSTARSAALGLAVGGALLFRSPLFLYPPVLLAWEWFRRPGGRRPSWREAACLLALPYACLLPWVWMNWVVTQQIVIFEHNEATPNIVTGAVGMLHTSDGDWMSQELFGASGMRDDLPGLLRWALGRILEDPLRYLGSIVRRVGYVFGHHPWLGPAALAAAWISRRRTEVEVTVLLTVYYLMIHCLMAVQEGYFRPLWPLLMVLAATLVGAGGRPWPEAAAIRGATAALGLGLALSLSAAAASWAAVVSYGSAYRRRDPGSADALAAALRRDPGDAWLHSEQGRLLLESGRPREAAAAYRRSLRLRRAYPERQLRMHWARLQAGEPRGLQRFKWPEWDTDRGMREEFHVLKACALQVGGDRDGAREQLRAAYALRASRSMPGLAAPSPLRASYETVELSERMRGLWAARPPRERGELFALAAELAPRQASAWLELGAARLEFGDRLGARRALKRAEVLAVIPPEIRRLAWLWGAAGEPGRVLSVLERHRGIPGGVGGIPFPAEALIGLARQAGATGRREQARSLLAVARSLGGPSLRRLDIHDATLELGDIPAARRLWEELASEERRVAAAAWTARFNRASDRGESTAALRLVRQAPPEIVFPVPAMIGLARRSASQGRRGEARQLLNVAETFPGAWAHGADLHNVYLEVGELQTARKIAGGLAPSDRPRAAAGWLDESIRAWRRGDRAGFRSFMAEALAMGLPDSELVSASARLGDSEAARAALAMISSRSPQATAGVWIGQARVAGGRGEAGLARELLSRGLALGPRSSDLHAAALLRQQLGDHVGAKELLDKLVGSHPREALYVKDRALSAYLEGDIGTAIRDLERAAQLDPGLLEAYVSLAAAHAGRGDFRAALTAAERGLAAKTRRAQPELRAKLEQTRRELAARLGVPGTARP